MQPGIDRPQPQLIWSRRAALFVAAILLTMLGTSSTASAAEPAVWVGSPLDATWPTGDSMPDQHHAPYGGHWSADLQTVTVGAPVVLYAAPQDEVTTVEAVVETVRPACKSGAIASGGYRVTVGLFTGGTKIGTATYAHIEPSVSEGSTIPRWGTQLGVVGDYTPGSCWTAPHVHVEMFSQNNASCYNGTWEAGEEMRPVNFIGFVGGTYAAGPCP